MRTQIAETYSHRFDSPFTAWLYQVSMDGCDDEFGTIDEFGYWVGRLGRHVIIEDSQGFVYSMRPLASATGPAFYAWADEYFGADRMAEYFDSGES